MSFSEQQKIYNNGDLFTPGGQLGEHIQYTLTAQIDLTPVTPTTGTNPFSRIAFEYTFTNASGGTIDVLLPAITTAFAAGTPTITPGATIQIKCLGPDGVRIRDNGDAVTFATLAVNQFAEIQAITSGAPDTWEVLYIASSSGGGGATTLQDAYDNSVDGEIVLDTTRNAFKVQGAVTDPVQSLLSVVDNAGTTNALTVSRNASGFAIAGFAATSNNANTLAVGSGASATAASAIAMGNTAVASNTNAVALGNATTASGSGSIAVGRSITASAIGSVAIGGNFAVAVANNIANSIMLAASGKLIYIVNNVLPGTSANSGNKQTVCGSVQTVNAATQILVTLTPNTNSSISVSYNVIGHTTPDAGAANSYSYTGVVKVKNTGGTVSYIATAQQIISDTPVTTPIIDFVIVGAACNVRATGILGSTINWTAYCDYCEVTA